ncbi:hypothetical protein BO70DRAFT_361890 [Aspergillus heteromorphus CBS 117.55]|uniref:Uncharacterized protein n=1 Tax=Aspergillus heteromorphus CBS 117.55 TaxID=1448321 RepID=A0A317WD58_9EURO|nr:uncharacterized protein BO70DRAFT_361890 [Aspergillus heteromorphus CBS 117.55]PWY82968.1 hypothetical protein BO70DRAFT_361890 [Aspergillus heteromorphus CBS 117.55]
MARQVYEPLRHIGVSDKSMRVAPSVTYLPASTSCSQLISLDVGGPVFVVSV